VQIDLLYALREGSEEDILSRPCYAVKRFTEEQEERHLVAFVAAMVACADGVVQPSERLALQSICEHLSIEWTVVQEMLDDMLRAFNADGNEDELDKHYDVLGLERGATLQEVKAAFREKAKLYHPDKVSHLGPELQSVAEERFKAINEAYQAVLSDVPGTS